MNSFKDPMYWAILVQILLTLPSTIADTISIIKRRTKKNRI